MTQFPFIQLPCLDIRMIPKKMLAVKEQEDSPILSKNPRKEVLAQLFPANSASFMFSLQLSDLSLLVIAPKVSVHRFAVVRVRVKRRIVGALDLIIRRGVCPFPESEPGSKKPKAKDREPNPEVSRILLHDPTLADPRAWILPGMPL